MRVCASDVGPAWRAAAAPVIAAVAVHLGLMAQYLTHHGGDPAFLVNVGRLRLAEPSYAGITVATSPEGYDGQFYYALARNPWKPHWQAIDVPPVRHLRLLYPAVCWLFSGGRPGQLVWVMPLVNLAAIGGLAGLGAWVAHRFGRSAWWGFALPLVVNAGLPSLHDLTDTLSTLAVSALLTAWLLRARAGVVALCCLAAVFAREQNVAVALIVLAVSACRGRYRVAAGITAALGLWLAWVGLLHATYGAWPFLPRKGNFDVPFAGWLHRWHVLTSEPRWPARSKRLFLWSMVDVMPQTGLAVYLVLTRRAEAAVSLLLVAAVALAASAGNYIYDDCGSYVRILVWLPLGIWFACIAGGRCREMVLLLPTALWALYAAVRI